MMKILKRPMTASCRCSELPVAVLLTVILALLPLGAKSQRTVWELPEYMETVSAGSLTLGGTFARDTYLSASS